MLKRRDLVKSMAGGVGNHGIMVKATNDQGIPKRALIPNPAGYHHNLVQRINIRVG